jgi:hypothetical protein
MRANKTNRAFPFAKFALACGLLAAAMLVDGVGHAASRNEVEHRQQMLRDSAAAADQRSQQQRNIADKQRELLEYQVRKNKRMQMKMQCQLAGGGTAC